MADRSSTDGARASARRRHPGGGRGPDRAPVPAALDSGLRRNDERVEAIVAEARSWAGTPYRHQASVKGAGCDCIGLIRGVWRAMVGPEPERLPAYSRDFGATAGLEPLLAVARRRLIAIDPGDAGPGDVLVFRMQRHVPAKHAAILTAAGSSGAAGARMIHAREGTGVVEVSLDPWWARRIVAAFRFPEAH